MTRLFQLLVRSHLILGVALIATGLSLGFPRWQYAETSEEGAFALWGFPSPMIRSGLFYANYFSLDRQRTWLERKLYIYNHTSLTDQPQIYPAGILSNLAIYTGLTVGFTLLIWQPQPIARRQKEFDSNHSSND